MLSQCIAKQLIYDMMRDDLVDTIHPPNTGDTRGI